MLRYTKPPRKITLSIRMLLILVISLAALLLACNDTGDEMASETETNATEKSDVFSDATGGRVEKPKKSELPQGPSLTIADTSINISGNDSETIDIPIHISGAPDVAGIQFELLYDPASLRFEDIIPGTLTKDFIFEAAADQSNGVIRVAAVGARDSKGTGEIAIAKFKPLKEDKSQINIQNLIVADGNLKPIRILHKPAAIIIRAVKKTTTVPKISKPTEIPKKQTARDATAVPRRR